MCLHAEAGEMVNVYRLIIVVLDFADNNDAEVHRVPLGVLAFFFMYLFLDWTMFNKKNTTLKLVHIPWGEWHTQCVIQRFQFICQPHCLWRKTPKAGNENQQWLNLIHLFVFVEMQESCDHWFWTYSDSACMRVCVGQTHLFVLSLWNFTAVFFMIMPENIHKKSQILFWGSRKKMM